MPGGSCCDASASCGCSGPVEAVGRKIGYSAEELQSAPQGANLGLGCGNVEFRQSVRDAAGAVLSVRVFGRKPA